MPIYEYKCLKCGYEDQLLSLKIRDKIFVECSKCGTAMERKISKFAFKMGDDGTITKKESKPKQESNETRYGNLGHIEGKEKEI